MASSDADPGAGALVGRHRERAALDELLDHAVTGRGGCVVMVSDGGMGKTRLAQHTVAAAGTRGLPTHTVSCRATPIDVPFGALRELLGPAIGLPVDATRGLLAAGATGHQEWATADQLAAEVMASVADSGQLLIIEDLHAADRGTRRVVEMLVERSGQTGLALVLTARPPEADTALHDRFRTWAQEYGVRVYELAPLDDEEVGELLAVAGAPHRAGGRDALIDAARGNPLLVLASLRATQLDDTRVPSAAPRSVIGQIVASLPERSRRTVQAAAVLADAATVSLVAAVRTRAALDVVAELDTAVTAGVLVRSDVRYEFRHELYREAVLAAMTADARAAVHRDVARVLMRNDGHEPDVAAHLVLGAAVGDVEAISWLRAAAARQCRSAPGAALVMIDAAIRLSPRRDLELELVRFEALAGSGRSADAVVLGHILLHDIDDPALRARLHRDLALARFVQGDAVGAEREMGCAVDLLAGHPGHERAMAEQAFARLLALDLAGACELAADAGLRASEAHAVVAAESVGTVGAVFQARFHDAASHADRMLEHAARPTATEAHQYQPWFCAALLAAETDDLTTLAALVDHGREEATRTGSLWAIPAYDAVAAFAALRSGHLSDAAALACAVIGGPEVNDSFGVAAWCHAIQAQVALAQGDVDLARAHSAEGGALAAVHGTGFGLDHLAMCRSYLAEIDGATRPALHHLAELWDAFSAVGLHCPRQWLGPRLVRLAMASGDTDRAGAVVDALNATAERTGLRSMRADALVARSWLEGTPDAARAAAETLSGSPRRFARGEALVAVAVLGLRRGQRRSAREATLAAGDELDAVGATALAEAARLMAPGRETGRPRARSGLDALTRSERTVIGLVQEGLPNEAIASRLHLSRRTIESHLSAAYRKLGVANRVELLVAMRNQGPTDAP